MAYLKRSVLLDRVLDTLTVEQFDDLALLNHGIIAGVMLTTLDEDLSSVGEPEFVPGNPETHDGFVAINYNTDGRAVVLINGKDEVETAIRIVTAVSGV